MLHLAVLCILALSFLHPMHAHNILSLLKPSPNYPNLHDLLKNYTRIGYLFFHCRSYRLSYNDLRYVRFICS